MLCGMEDDYWDELPLDWVMDGDFWGGGHGYSGCHRRGIPVDCAPEV
jgi:hypothetical protein